MELIGVAAVMLLIGAAYGFGKIRGRRQVAKQFEQLTGDYQDLIDAYKPLLDEEDR